MRIRARLAAGVAAIALMAAGTTPTPARAATTYTPTGGLSVTFVGTSISFTDIEAALTISCSQFDLSGSVIGSGSSRAYGADAVSFTSVTPGGCSNALSGATAATPLGTWTFAITGDVTGGAWPARLKNVQLRMQAGNCTFLLRGVVSGKFDQGSGRFTPVSGASGLVVAGGTDAPTGSLCATLDILEGDTIEVRGTGASWPAGAPPA